MENMIGLLLDAFAIIIAAISLRRSSKYNKKVLDLEIEKEKRHREEREEDEKYMKLNSRSGLTPYFDLILDNSKIEKIPYNGSEGIKLVISLMNVGKGLATNIMIHNKGKRFEDYLETSNEKANGYFVHDYLSQCFAMPKECVTFSVVTEIPKDYDGKINDFRQPLKTHPSILSFDKIGISSNRRVQL